MPATVANVTNFTDNSFSSTVSFSHTSSGTNPCLVLSIRSASDNGGPAVVVTGCTFNGDNLVAVGGTSTSINDAANGVHIHTEIWGLLNPDAGTFTVQVSFDGSPLEVAVTAYTFAGVDGATPLGTGVSATGTSSTATVDASSQTDALVLDAIVASGFAGSITVGASQTERHNVVIGGFGVYGSSTEPGASTVTMSWDLGASDDWAISAVSVNPASAPPATLTISVSDSIVVPDVIVVESIQRLLVSASDAVTVTEFVSAGRTLGISRFDLVTVTEFATIDLSLRRITVFDAVGVADAIFLSSIAPRMIDVSDSVGVNVGAAQVSWTANTEPDLAGYKVYYGTSSGVYTTVIDVGLTATPATPSHTIYNLTKGVTYYFNVTAYDTSNNESGFGTEVSKLVRGPVGNWYQVSILQGSLTKIESVSVAEAVTVNVAPKPSASDLRSVAEFWQVFIANNGSVGIDTLTITESVSLLLATAPTVTISVFEAVTLSESITLKRPELLSTFDAVTIAESHSLDIVSGVSGADSITVEEAVSLVFPTNQISPFDSLAVTELVSLMLNPAQFSVFDQIFMGEGHEGRFVAIGTGTGDGTGRVTQIAGISGITVIT